MRTGGATCQQALLVFAAIRVQPMVRKSLPGALDLVFTESAQGRVEGPAVAAAIVVLVVCIYMVGGVRKHTFSSMPVHRKKEHGGMGGGDN